MKSTKLVYFLGILLSIFLSSCGAIKGIFNAGVGIGAIAVIIVVLLIYFISRSKKE